MAGIIYVVIKSVKSLRFFTLIIATLPLLFTNSAFINSVFAHSGEDHGQETLKQSATASSRTVTKTVETGQGVFKTTLTQMPSTLRAGKETQFEIEVNEVIEGGFGNGLLPVETAVIRVDFKSSKGELTAGALNVHNEGRPGVYGIHYTFKSSGDYTVEFTVAQSSGVVFEV